MFELAQETLVQKVAIKNPEIVDRKMADVWISGGTHKIRRRYVNEIAHVNKTKYTMCGRYQGIAYPLEEITILCKPEMRAKYSIIQTVHKSGWLHILEVTFYAKRKFLLNKSQSQSIETLLFVN